MHVDQLHIPRVAGLQSTGAHAQRLRTADGGQVERPVEGDQSIRHSPALSRPTRGVHTGFQVAGDNRRQTNHRMHARIVTAGDVSTQADRHALTTIPTHRCHRVGEVRVGQRAVRHGRTAPSEQIRIGFGQVHAVMHDRAVGQQTKHIERFGVRPSVAVEDRVVFPIAFRAMRLGEAVVAGRQLAQSLQSRVGAAGDEPWGDDRLDGRRYRVETAVRRELTHLVDEPFGFGQRCGGVLAVVLGVGFRVVHHDLADEAALAEFGADVRQVDGGDAVDGVIVQDAGGAAGERGLDEMAMGAVGVREVGEAGLCRERVATEPAFERFVERGTGLRPLRGVQVQVREAGQEDLAVREAGEPVESGQFGADGVVLRVVRGEDGRDDAVGADEIQRLGAIRNVGFVLAAVGRALDGEGDGAEIRDGIGGDRFAAGLVNHEFHAPRHDVIDKVQLNVKKASTSLASAGYAPPSPQSAMAPIHTAVFPAVTPVRAAACPRRAALWHRYRQSPRTRPSLNC